MVSKDAGEIRAGRAHRIDYEPGGFGGDQSRGIDGMKKLNLNTPRNIRASLAKVANWTLNGDIDVKQSNAIAYICTVILQSIRTDDQERRIEEIEESLARIEAGNR